MTDLKFSEEVRQKAIDRLALLLSEDDLRTIVSRLSNKRSGKSVEWLVSSAENGPGKIRLQDSELAPFLIDCLHTELLQNPSVRYALLDAADRNIVDNLLELARNDGGGEGYEANLRTLAQKQWRPGRGWASAFAREFGFPNVFAGIPGEPQEPAFFEVSPFKPLNDLQDFQQRLVDEITDVLQAGAGANRAILNLPTGAGKTRTAVEALVRWKLSAGKDSGVLWIAQSEELCEQAVRAFQEVWIDQGHRKTTYSAVTIQRLWGSNKLDLEAADITVASIQKLHTILLSARSGVLKKLAAGIGVVVVDEAHRMESASYRGVLYFLGIDIKWNERSAIPLIGLTATPYRTVSEQARKLAQRFHRRILRPSFLGDDYFEVLRERGVLSRPIHRILSHESGSIIDAGSRNDEYMERFGDFSPDVVSELGEDPVRNALLLRELCSIGEDASVLFFGCSVEHAEAMAVLLRRRGRSAAAISANTATATRRFLIEEFRAKRIQYLCNYQVLTTGFDAPKVDVVVISRPTASPVLYEQMIGRGMRGPLFGGTANCIVIDVEDNLTHRERLAFRLYDTYWRDDAT